PSPVPAAVAHDQQVQPLIRRAGHLDRHHRRVRSHPDTSYRFFTIVGALSVAAALTRRSASIPRRPCIALRRCETSTVAVTTVSLPAGIERDLKRTGVLGVLPFLRVLRSRSVPEIETVHGMSQR